MAVCLLLLGAEIQAWVVVAAPPPQGGGGMPPPPPSMDPNAAAFPPQYQADLPPGYPTPPPMPTNPRMNPQRPQTSGDAMRDMVFLRLMEQKNVAENPGQAASAGDMKADLMSTDGKVAQAMDVLTRSYKQGLFASLGMPGKSVAGPGAAAAPLPAPTAMPGPYAASPQPALSHSAQGSSVSSIYDADRAPTSPMSKGGLDALMRFYKHAGPPLPGQPHTSMPQPPRPSLSWDTRRPAPPPPGPQHQAPVPQGVAQPPPGAPFDRAHFDARFGNAQRAGFAPFDYGSARGATSAITDVFNGNIRSPEAQRNYLAFAHSYPQGYQGYANALGPANENSPTGQRLYSNQLGRHQLPATEFSDTGTSYHLGRTVPGQPGMLGGVFGAHPPTRQGTQYIANAQHAPEGTYGVMAHETQHARQVGRATTRMDVPGHNNIGTSEIGPTMGSWLSGQYQRAGDRLDSGGRQLVFPPTNTPVSTDNNSVDARRFSQIAAQGKRNGGYAWHALPHHGPQRHAAQPGVDGGAGSASRPPSGGTEHRSTSCLTSWAGVAAAYHGDQRASWGWYVPKPG